MHEREPGIRPRSRSSITVCIVVAMLLAGCGSADPPPDEASGEVLEQPSATSPETETDDAGSAGSEQGTETTPEAPSLSSDAPRVDIDIYPGAQLVYEEVWPVAVEEFWAVDAPLDDVVEFYAAMPGYEGLAGSRMTQDDGGGYLETDIARLIRSGETDPAAFEELVDEIGPLIILAVVTSESQALGGLLGREGVHDAIPDGHTVIVIRALTG